MNYSLFTDEILSRLLRTSDTQAFHEIYQRYWKRLYATALRKIGKKEIAEEIIQDIFETLWEKHATTIIENIESYLFSSVKYGVIGYYKSQIVEEKYIQFIQNNAIEEEKTEEILCCFNGFIQRTCKRNKRKTLSAFKCKAKRIEDSRQPTKGRALKEHLSELEALYEKNSRFASVRSLSLEISLKADFYKFVDKMIVKKQEVIEKIINSSL